MKINKVTLIGVVLAFMFSIVKMQAQSSNQAYEILEASIGHLDEKKGFALHFEGVAYELQKPLEIFSMPSYKVFRGGYLYVQGDKYELKLANTGAISNGVIYLVTDELNKMVYVDSINRSHKDETQYGVSLTEFLDKNIKDENIKLEGEEMVKGDLCYKIKAGMNIHEKDTHVLYYIGKKDKKLKMMAEWVNGSYTVYWIRSIGKAPSGHNYDFGFPTTQVEDLEGYKVFDFRYINLN